MRRVSLVSAVAAAAVICGLSTRASAQILSDEPATPAPRPPTPTPPTPTAPPPPTTPPATAVPPATPPPSSGVSPQAAQPIPPPAAAATANGGAAVATPAPAQPGAEEEKTIDHDRFVGHFAIGYLGISQLPIATAGGGGTGVITAPVIGGRYWLRRNMGIDAGIGFASSSGSTTSGATSVDKPGQFGLALHGGVPFALAFGKHYVFQVIPEATIGFTSATLKGNNTDVDLSGFRLDLGARAGAEIHFGFIGVPELSLQATIGVFIHRESRTASAKGGQEQSDGTTTIATSVQGDPWALFANSISALYYF